MHSGLPFIAGTASWALLTISGAQTTFSIPVGWETVNVAGSTAAAYSAIGPSLVNKVEFSGIVAQVTGAVVTVSDELSPGTFASGFWLEITNGVSEGTWTHVSGNSRHTIVTSADISSLMTPGTTTIAVRKHVTIADFFGSGNSAGLESGADAGLATTIFLFENGAPAHQVFYDGTGWFDASFNDASDMPIDPGQGCLVLRKAGNTPRSFVHIGYVKTGISRYAVPAGKSVIAVRSAVGTTLRNSGLRPSPPNDVATGLLTGPDAGLADNVILFSTTGVPSGYFPDAGQWFDFNFSDADTVTLAPGQGICIIRRHPTGFVYRAPAVSISP